MWDMSWLTLLAVLNPLQEPGSGQIDPTLLEDVVVAAGSQENMARTFVDRVSAPARDRGLGRWRSICPAVTNLQRDAAQALIDRIAAVALDIGVTVGPPGCRADLVIIFSTDGAELAQAMVRRDSKVFRPTSAAGLDRGAAALERFQNSDRPVRWWHSSVPIDRQTGQRAVRVSGDAATIVLDRATALAHGCTPTDCAFSSAPAIGTTTSSRLSSQIVDQIHKAIIIVDIDAVSGFSSSQLGDYLALVSLAQTDPEAEVGGFDTILNLFDGGEGRESLSGWDRRYLHALYRSPSTGQNVNSQISAVAGIMTRDTSSPAD